VLPVISPLVSLVATSRVLKPPDASAGAEHVLRQDDASCRE
jgi:hypothetical protein